ncbi:MAG: bacterioferritin [Proteobacteria bacterium]|nr:bacterioferritin [Pseudomonadota bacterium]
MKGNAKVIAALNDILTGELTAINQYFLHAKMCKNWGFNIIGDKIYKESIDEMKHASQLTDRILFLEGLPNLQRLGKLKIGENVKEQLESDLALEMEAIPRLRVAIELCWEASDHGTRDLLEKILVSEEEHADWIETQLSVIKDIGLQNYLSQQIGDRS